MNQKQTRNVHQKQFDQKDCGPACLMTALRFYGGSANLEWIRDWSGTSPQGTTLLGLQQAAQRLGFEAGGYEADFDSLKLCEDLCILHIIKEEKLPHYILCYGYDENRNAFRVSDPAEHEPDWISEEELSKVWQSKALLRLTYTQPLRQQDTTQTGRWGWLFRIIRPDLPILGIAFALGVAISVMSIALALFSQQLIDYIIPKQDQLQLFLGVTLLLLVLVARIYISYIRQILLQRQSRDLNLRLSEDFYRTLLYLPKPFFDTRKIGDLVARLNDTQRIQRTLAVLVGSSLIDLLSLVAALSFMFVYSWQIGLTTLCWLPIFLFIILRFHRPILNKHRQAMAAYAYKESHYIDSIQGIGVIKVFNQQENFARITHGVFNHFQQTTLQLGYLAARFGATAESISSVFLTIIIGWSGWQAIQGELSLGGLIAILQIAAVILTTTAQLSAAHLMLLEARVAFDRIHEFSILQPEYTQESEAAQQLLHTFATLKVDELKFRFSGRQLLLKGLSFELARGEWISILGESGCGKSTLLQLLQKFYLPESGQILVNDISLENLSNQNWRTRIGVVPQEIKIFNGTLIDNIILDSENYDDERFDQFMTQYGFEYYFRQLPNAYGTLLGEEGVNLSGGQKQLVALARALYHQPELLLLDEPTSSLDRDTESFVLQLLERLKKSMGLIVLTHRLRTARAADRIYIIEDGRIDIFGQHNALLQNNNLYSRAWSDLFPEAATMD